MVRDNYPFSFQLEQIMKDVDIIAKELQDYDKELSQKDKWYVFNKIDNLSKDEVKILKNHVAKKIDLNTYYTSALKKEGLDVLCEDVIEYLRDELSDEKL